MIRKIVAWDRIDDLVWFHTASPDPAVLNWIDTGVILPPDSSHGVWGWAVHPTPPATAPTK